MKKFLDRIKDQTKNFVEEVKEKNKGNRTELMLMGGCACVSGAVRAGGGKRGIEWSGADGRWSGGICGGCGRRKLSRG